MTDDGSGTPGTPGDDRTARLAALLSVDISVPSAGDGGRRAETVEPAESADSDETVSDGGRHRTGGLAWAVLVVLLLAGSGLVYGGTRLIRSSTEGEVLAPIVDPAEPGFEALVDPSPTLALLHDVDGTLDAITVLSLATPDGGGGGVLLVPRRTVTELPLVGDAPVEAAYDPEVPIVQADAVGILLGSAMREVAIVDDARWADLVAPVVPIEIDNPNELLVDGEVQFPAGSVELGAADVGPYLRATVEGESDLARLFRHQVFWDAWLDAVADDGSDAAVPGELDSGVGRFVRALARDGNEIETLPVQPSSGDDPDDDPDDLPTFVPRFDQLRALVDRFIPLPVSPGPGLRARVRVLNGTTDTTAASAVAGSLPPAGVEVTAIGNAATLDIAVTTIEFTGEEFRDEAEALAEILGVGVVVEDTRPSDAVDITVTLGADHV
ncbi:LytR C-terminal domain-containing protein [Actinospongicola halichondriae]|uniref:LytR C-terminal domain-containing protein n=1 Tax=Actinospongicola halichondriae TaxID=3236844 RepID=UPI003D4EFE3A